MPTKAEVDKMNSRAYEYARATNTPEVNRLQAQLMAAKDSALLHASLKPGELRELIETDRTGRRISKFVGDPGAAWEPFKLPVRLVVGFNGQ